ncbi:hypothetical protein RUND412_005924 [Rhizina undulata]
MASPKLTRKFSFQSDDDPSYHPIPSTTSTPRLPRRRDSSSSSSSSSYEDEIYPRTISRKPVPLASEGEPYNTLTQEVSPSPTSDPRATPVGGIRANDRYWGQELGYASHPPTPAPQPQAVPEYNLAGTATAIAGVYYYPFMDETPIPPTHRGDMMDSGKENRVLVDPSGGHYTDNPYKRYSTTWDPSISASQIQVDGAGDGDILSDDEDVLHRPGLRGGAGSAAAAAAAGGPTVMATLGARVGRPVSMEGSQQGMAGSPEKSEWLQQQSNGKKRTRWIIALILLLVVLGAAGGAAAGVILSKRHSGSSSAAVTDSSGGGLTSAQDVAANGDLNKNSPEILALMGNPNLKKVFHGMDYTPLNAQYPQCLTVPPTQNNVTRDIAVLSQLTSRVRLYGNDCNQTEMVVHAIQELGVDMKVWLGVWLDNNVTTNDRQISHLYTLVANYDQSFFDGVAVGNEVLFREDLTESQLVSTIEAVRTNLTALNVSLPVGTSDLGSNWKASMVTAVDVVMANIHPFFAGVTVQDAGNWTYDFFQSNDVYLTKGMTNPPRTMISETGWPTSGGHINGSVAGISELNYFMQDFLCTQNNLGTEYFWFEGFDEPWKIIYDTPGEDWEDHWGVLDINRNLKSGVVIPDCFPSAANAKRWSPEEEWGL